MPPQHDIAQPARPGLRKILACLSARFEARGHSPLASGDKATLRRLDPEAPSRAVPVLVPLLLAAGLDERDLRTADRLGRWASIVQAMAILAGTVGTRPHAPAHERADDGSPIRHAAREMGRALALAGFSEARLMRLTSTRGAALPGLVSRTARFLAGRTGPLDLEPLARLVLNDGRDEARADAARLDIARGFYATSPEDRPATADMPETSDT